MKVFKTNEMSFPDLNIMSFYQGEEQFKIETYQRFDISASKRLKSWTFLSAL